jgi:hypothetical protein
MRISLPILDHVAKAIISRIPKVEDRSLFIHDILIRMKMWTHEGICPIVTRVFGTITIDGKPRFLWFCYSHNFSTFQKQILNNRHDICSIIIMDKSYL